MEKAEPTENKIEWNRKNKLSITCCVKAFSPNDPCDLAFCQPCFAKRTEGFKEEVNATKKRRKTSRRKGTSAAKTPVGEKQSKCGKHTIDCLKSLNVEVNEKGYLADNRKTVSGWENIATTCWDCGDSF